MNKNEEEFGVVITANTNPIKKAFKDLQGFIKNVGKEIEESSTVNTEEEEKKVTKYSTSLKILGSVGKRVFEVGSLGAKLFAAGILGIGSAILTLSNKYTSIYYKFNEQFRYQAELTKNTLALSLAPVIELFGNIAKKVAIFIGILAESLFGINVFGKLATQGIMDYNKQLKQTKSLLGGIDEITNLSGGTGGLGSDISNQFQALADFQKEVAEMKEKLNNSEFFNGLINFLKKAWVFLGKVWSIIEKIGKWVWDNRWWLKYVVIGVGVLKIGFSIVGNIAKIIGTASIFKSTFTAGTGLAGLGSILYYLTTLTAISVSVGIVISEYEKLKEMIQELKDLKEEREGYENQTIKYGKDAISTIKNTLKEMETLDKDTDEYKLAIQRCALAWDNVFSAIAVDSKIYDENKEDIDDIILKLSNMTGQDYTVELQLALDTNKARESSNSFLDDFWNGFASTANKIKNVFTGIFNTGKILTNEIKGNSGSSGYSSFGGTGRKYAKGLDYVPYDEYPALLHKGEAVVPAKYNPTIHSQGNEYTNSLLETLVTKFDDLSSRPNVFEIDGRKFASATYPLYRTEEARNNYNGKVSVKNG